MPVRSYTRRVRLRQIAPLAVLGLALGLAGCAGMGLPITEAQSQAALSGPAVKPAATAPARVTDSVEPSDWEHVRRTLAAIPADAKVGSEHAWHNPETGSDGTVTASAAATKSGALCRTFATTINDVRGIRGYRGETCRAGDGRWKLYNVTPDDGILL